MLVNGLHGGGQGELAVGVDFLEVVAQRGHGCGLAAGGIEVADLLWRHRLRHDIHHADIAYEIVESHAVGTDGDVPFRTDHQEVVLLMHELAVLIHAFHPAVEGDGPERPSSLGGLDSLGSPTALKRTVVVEDACPGVGAEAEFRGSQIGL